MLLLLLLMNSSRPVMFIRTEVRLRRTAKMAYVMSKEIPQVTFVNSFVDGRAMGKERNRAYGLCDTVFIEGLCDRDSNVEHPHFLLLILLALALIYIALALFDLHDPTWALRSGSNQSKPNQRRTNQRRNKQRKQYAMQVIERGIVPTAPAGPAPGICNDNEDARSGKEEGKTCAVCMDAPRDAAILHQGSVHICCCMRCARTIHESGGECPICRVPIESVLRAFGV